MKSKIAMSLLVIVVAISMIAGSTVAYFSDTGNASGNTFTSGTLDMQLNNGGGFDESVSGTWVSPLNWAPGQDVEGKIEFTNIGNVDVHHIYYNFTGSGMDTAFMDNIIVTSIVERFDGVTTADQAAKCASQTGNGDAVLTLRELVNQAWYTVDDVAGNDNVIAAGDAKDYSISFKFHFNDSAGNDMQGKVAGFNLLCTATQNSPTDGYVCIH